MPAKSLELVADTTDRVDRYVASHFSSGDLLLSRSKIKKLIESGDILVNSKEVEPSFIVAEGDTILVVIKPEESISIEPENIPLKIVYEDKDILVVDKPAGLVVHPAVGHQSGTLVNALMYHLGQSGRSAKESDITKTDDSVRVGIVHRLDKDTSGLMVVAKNIETQEALKKQFQNKTVAKTYLSLLNGRLDKKDGIIDKPIGRHLKNRQKFSIRNDGKKAVTVYKLLKEYDKYSLVEASPVTGRTHQIRVHFASLGNPVVGDATYGRKNPELGLNRHFLHAQNLKFIHPVTNQNLSFDSDLPEELNSVLSKLDIR